MGMPQLADLVQETANAPGTGAFTLGGAPAGRQTFADAFPAGGEVFYYASDGTQTEWGIGTLHVGSPNVLTRTTVLGNLFGSKTALNFSSSVMIWNEVPSGRTAFQDDAGQLPVSGNPDFTRDVALSAKAADGLFIRSPANPNTDARILTISRNKTSGGIFAAADDGSNTQLQPAGDYATNTALQAEIQRATTIESNLQSSKFDKAGGVISGSVAVSGSAGIIANYDTGGQVSGQVTQYARLSSYAGGRGGAFSLYVQELVGSEFQGVLLLGGNSKDRFLLLSSAGRLTDSLKGDFAYTSDLPFSDTTLKEQAFIQTQTPSGGNSYFSLVSFTFPTAFRTGTIPEVTLTIDSEPSGTWNSHPRVFSLARDNNGIIVTNTGFTITVAVCAGADVWASVLPVTAQIRAVGKF